MEIASDADIRRRPPRAPTPKPDAPQSPPIPVAGSPDNRVPIPGSTIMREYKGRLREVLVLDEGSEYAGEKLKSLSGVGKRIAELQSRIQPIEQRLSEVRDELQSLQRELIDETDIITALAQFDTVWQALKVAEQYRLIRLLIECVDDSGPCGRRPAESGGTGTASTFGNLLAV